MGLGHGDNLFYNLGMYLPKGTKKLTWVDAGPRVAIGTHDGRVVLLDLDGTASVLPGEGWVSRVRWSPDQRRLLVNHTHGVVGIFDADGAPVHELLTEQGFVADCVWKSDGTRFITGGRDKVRVWDAATWALLDEYAIPQPTTKQSGKPSPRQIRSLEYANDVVVIGLDSGSFIGWDGKEDWGGRVLGSEVSAIAVDPTGQSVLFGGLSGGMCLVTDFKAVESYAGTPPRPIAVNSLTWSPDGKRVAGAFSDNRATVFEFDERLGDGSDRGRPFWTESPKPGWHERMIVSCACFDFSGALWTAHYAGEIRRWTPEGERDQTWTAAALLGA